MSANNDNWNYNNRTTVSTRGLEATNESFEDVAIDDAVENAESARLLVNEPTTSAATNNTGSTSINIEFDNENSAVALNNRNPARSNSGGHFIRQQFYTFLNEARTHFVHPSTSNATTQQQQNENVNENPNANQAQSPDWRRNLNNILSLSILPNANNFQFATNNSPNGNTPTSPPRARSGSSGILMNEEHPLERVSSIHRRPSVVDHSNNNSNGNAHANNADNTPTSSASSASNSRSEEDNSFGTREPANNADDETQVASQMLIKFLTNLLRYVPFLCVLLLKFLHDHTLDIVDIAVHQFILFEINKSLCLQITKLAQKNYYILARDFCLVGTLITLRLHLSSGAVDPSGLLITPPHKDFIVVTQKPEVSDSLTTGNETIPKNSVEMTETISLSVLLYYVIINDLILKLLTVLIKIAITMLPPAALQPKPRSRLFVAVEYSSQFYRAFVPMKEWVLYLGSPYKGYEAISGIVFNCLYLIAKLFEFGERGKPLRKAVLTLLRNRDPDRKPTERELSAVDVCPICHDTFTSPVVIECGHIFCDDCVNTWLRREHTCPMCRAKVREDIDFQDGSTTSFYQIF